MPNAPSRGKLHLTLLAAFLGWMFDGMEMGIFPIVAGPALAEMSRGLHGAELKTFVSGWMGWATALFLWGAALGGIVFGWLGDKVGRVLAGFGALQMGTLVEKMGGSYERAGATIVLVYFVGMITIWFAPETRGQPLPE